MCPVTLSLRRDRREEMREGDRERRTEMCQATGQRDIQDMHGFPLDINIAERGVDVW